MPTAFKSIFTYIQKICKKKSKKKMCNLSYKLHPFLIFFLNDKSIFNVPCGFGLRATATMVTIIDALLS